MRTLLRARLDTHAGNEVIRDGTMPDAVQGLLDELKPEAAYFAAMDGGRTCLMVFDLDDPSRIPAVAEKLFLDLEAEVELVPVMNHEDLKKGLAALKKG
ncbi:hypothetical protein GCM10010218_02580 [Streptomyces mashuensis]|uniref:Uncharacterized protein n=1 Tax=Streptomyces mashuensis TaxID=33904 RepID=A0A919ASX4_9ACTN|nr:DUF3303 family protein [Streptomyces mashuensis]GHF25383.1 hypothetical protein GCM10010218_02580 [Streptomyces mashuensis]